MKEEPAKYDTAHIVKVLKEIKAKWSDDEIDKELEEIEAKLKSSPLAIDRLKNLKTIFNWSDGEIPVPDFEIDNSNQDKLAFEFDLFKVNVDEKMKASVGGVMEISCPICEKGQLGCIESPTVGMTDWAKAFYPLEWEGMAGDQAKCDSCGAAFYIPPKPEVDEKMKEESEIKLYKMIQPHENYFDKPTIKLGYQTIVIEPAEPLIIRKPNGKGSWLIRDDDTTGELMIEWK